MNARILILCCLLIASVSFSQTLSKYGVKGGLIFTGMETANISSVFADSSAFLNFLSFDFGVYAEMFNSKKFCISAELHYSVKGERNPNFNKLLVPITSENHPYYEYQYLSDRFHFLSIQLLPKYRFVITPSGENIYVIGGGKIDMLVKNNNSGDNKEIKGINNFRFDFGVTAGLGIEVMNFLSFEFRYERSLRGPYEILYGDKTVTRTFNSVMFLTGISFRKKNYFQ